jgi:hypothetical protein
MLHEYFPTNELDLGIVQHLDFNKKEIKEVLKWRHPLTFSGIFSLVTI